MDNYELYHHGVKGQKWGVRRSPAQLGRGGKAKSVLNKAVSSIKKNAARKAKEIQEKRYYEGLKKKRLSDMTDKEVKDLTTRLKKEADLKDARYEYRMKTARKFYQNVAKQPVDSFAKSFGATAGKALAENLFPAPKKDNK